MSNARLVVMVYDSEFHKYLNNVDLLIKVYVALDNCINFEFSGSNYSSLSHLQTLEKNHSFIRNLFKILIY